MQRSEQEISRRGVPGAASAAPLPPKIDSVADLCLAWFRADVRLEALTLEWSQAEASVIVAEIQPERAGAAARMHRLERRIAHIDQRRSGLRDRIVATPARGPEEALGKLLVVKRLLEGEGGAEHDIVADAVMRLAAVLGLND